MHPPRIWSHTSLLLLFLDRCLRTQLSLSSRAYMEGGTPPLGFLHTFKFLERTLIEALEYKRQPISNSCAGRAHREMADREMADQSEDDGFVIGYALLEKKQRSFLQESLVRRVGDHGIRFIAVDLQRPLALQGPFHAILHKLSSSSWNAQLATYALTHPQVLIVDSPPCIERLHNRVSMLQVLDGLQNIATPSASNVDYAMVQVPKQCAVLGGEPEQERLALLARLHFPVIAKPLIVDGSTKSHAMSLAFNADSLAKLTPPLVLQEFINHGGVIFKVYVAGEHVQCVRRKSLPDLTLNEIKNVREPLSFCQISNTSSSASSDDPDLQGIELPPMDFLENFALGLKRALGLRLFNFDIIRDAHAVTQYYIIDINYFPGYAKMPNYEAIMTDFFLSLRKEQAMLV